MWSNTLRFAICPISHVKSEPKVVGANLSARVKPSFENNYTWHHSCGSYCLASMHMPYWSKARQHVKSAKTALSGIQVHTKLRLCSSFCHNQCSIPHLRETTPEAILQLGGMPCALICIHAAPRHPGCVAGVGYITYDGCHKHRRDSRAMKTS